MSDEELRDRINKIASEIEKVEETAKKKKEYIASKITEDFDPKINELKLELQNQQTFLDQLNKNIDELNVKKKNLIPIIKSIEKEYNDLLKKKDRALNEKMKAIIKEKKTKTKIIDQDIKLLEKELKAEKTK